MWTSNVILAALVHASGYNLMFLTIERYWAITKPLTYDPTKVRRRLPFIFIASWLIGIVSMFPKMTTTRAVGDSCRLYIDFTSVYLMKFLTPYYITVACIIPAGVMFYCYGAIWMTLRKSQELQSKDTQSKSTTLKSVQMNLLQTCIILMCLFVVSWFQHATIFLLFTIGVLEDLHGYIYHSSVLVLKVNNCLNPFVYTVRYKTFQDQIKYLICKPRDLVSQLTKTSS